MEATGTRAWYLMPTVRVRATAARSESPSRKSFFVANHRAASVTNVR
jgi:hypothetical protein